jgi:hypothetical protein
MSIVGHVSLLRVSDLGEATNIYLRYSPSLVIGLKHRQVARQVGDLVKDLMVKSMASIVIKPTTAFNRGNTFTFGSRSTPLTVLVHSSATSP